jgi:dienelactone hydrolase
VSRPPPRRLHATARRRAGAALLLATLAGMLPRIVLAEDYHREDLRIPFAAAGPRGLEALLIRPQSGGPRFPLALISHGSPRDGAERIKMSPYQFYAQALEFARRGFAAVVVMRRGYGASGGAAETGGPCGRRDYVAEARYSVADLKAAVDAMARRPDVTTDGMIAVGHSAGGFNTVALTADPPPGLVAAISFAGGRGSRADNDVCQDNDLVSAFGVFGRTSHVPMLWVYAQNDKFFGPALAWRLFSAFAAAGGKAEFLAAPAFGSEGHFLFSSGTADWPAMVDGFLAAHQLGLRPPLDPPAPPALAPPPQLSASGRKDFATYLAANPHKAFAVAANGAYAWRTRQRDADAAQAAAREACAKYRPDCVIYAVDDGLTREAGARAR